MTPTSPGSPLASGQPARMRLASGGVESDRPPDLARTVLQLLALAVLIASSFWIVRPFLVPVIWATTIAVATWPLLLHTQAWLGGRRSLAVAAMTIALL